MAKILGKTHKSKVLGADTHSLSLNYLCTKVIIVLFTGLFLIGPGLDIYFITFVEFHNMIIYNKNYILKINE